VGHLATLIWQLHRGRRRWWIAADPFAQRVSASFRGNGRLAVLIPFAMAVYWRIRRGTFEDDADLLNAAPDKVEAASEPEKVETHVAAPIGALSNATLGLLAVCVVAGAVGAGKLKPERLGDYLKVSVSAKEATTRAQDVLKKRGVTRITSTRRPFLGMPRTPPQTNTCARKSESRR